MSNAMSAMSSEERQGLRESRLHGPGDHLIEVSRDALVELLLCIDAVATNSPTLTNWIDQNAVERLRSALR